MASVLETAFTSAASNIFATFGAAATYHALQGGATTVACNVVIVPAGASTFRGQGIAEEDHAANVYALASEVTPANRGQFTVGSVVWTIDDGPEDLRCGVWKCRCTHMTRIAANERRMKNA